MSKITKNICICLVIGIVFMFVPFAITMSMTGVIEENITDSLVELRRVSVNYKNASKSVDISRFMIGVLAARLDYSKEIEVLKAESIMVRTDIYRLMGDEMEIDSAELGMNYLTENEMRDKWGEDYEENYNLISDCIAATSGKAIRKNGNMINAKYTYVSSGKTRSNENWGEEYAHLKSVECSEDLMAEGFLCVNTLSEQDLIKKLKTKYDKNLEEKNILDTIQIISRDEGEYVDKMQIGNVVLTGDEFAKLMGLNSSCFYIEKVDESQLKVTTKGFGDGYGVSLYSAEIMAKNGSSSEEILRHFYSGIDIISE